MVIHIYISFIKYDRTQVQINKTVQRNIVNSFLPIILAYVLDVQENRLVETVLLSTKNICFGREIS